MNAHTKQKQEGFTIIEVVLVLAIAALIFLMVFIALPALQRSQRDTQRRNDVSRISTQLTSYQSAARGSVPTNATQLGTFTSKYLGGASTSQAGDEYQDPKSGNYTISFVTSDPSSLSEGTVYYVYGRVCADDGTGGTRDGSNRNYSLLVKLESQDVGHCVSNK